MAFVWDLIQQFQLQELKSRAGSSAASARTAEARARSLASQLESLEDEVASPAR